MDEMFELLELAWWQNPWWWSVLIAISVVIGLIITVVGYFVCRRYMSSSRRMIRQLNGLKKYVLSAHHEQVHAYNVMMVVLKEYVSLVTGVGGVHLTDKECMRIIQGSNDIELVACVEAVCQAATLVKFGRGMLECKVIQGHIQELERHVASGAHRHDTQKR